MCVLEGEVKGGSHNDKSGDKEGEGAYEDRGEELLFELAGVSASSRGEGPNETDQEEDDVVGVKDIVLHAAELVLAEEVDEAEDVEDAAE